MGTSGHFPPRKTPQSLRYIQFASQHPLPVSGFDNVLKHQQRPRKMPSLCLEPAFPCEIQRLPGTGQASRQTLVPPFSPWQRNRTAEKIGGGHSPLPTLTCRHPAHPTMSHENPVWSTFLCLVNNFFQFWENRWTWPAKWQYNFQVMQTVKRRRS